MQQNSVWKYRTKCIPLNFTTQAPLLDKKSDFSVCKVLMLKIGLLFCSRKYLLGNSPTYKEALVSELGHPCATWGLPCWHLLLALGGQSYSLAIMQCIKNCLIQLIFWTQTHQKQFPVFLLPFNSILERHQLKRQLISCGPIQSLACLKLQVKSLTNARCVEKRYSYLVYKYQSSANQRASSLSPAGWRDQTPEYSSVSLSPLENTFATSFSCMWNRSQMQLLPKTCFESAFRTHIRIQAGRNAKVESMF